MKQNIIFFVIILCLYHWKTFGQSQENELYNSKSYDHRSLETESFSKDRRELQHKIDSLNNRINRKYPSYNSRYPINNYMESPLVAPPFNEKEIVSRKADVKISTSRVRGTYFLPFAGLSKSSNLSWKVPKTGAKYNVKQSNGFVVGAECGYQWDLFFTSIGFKYNQSTLKSIELGGTTMSFEGKEYLFGLFLSEGITLSFREKWSFSASIGLGFVFQDYSALLARTFDHNDFDFTSTYNFSTSINFYPTENFNIGLGYKFIRVGDLEYYTARNMNIITLSCSLEI